MKNKYSMCNSDVYMTMQERQRVLINLLNDNLALNFEDASVLEVGCGDGRNLLELIYLGFTPSNISGVELLTARAVKAQANLPQDVRIYEQDANKINFESGSFDFVYLSTVFSSILNFEVQKTLAEKMWIWTKKGGAFCGLILFMIILKIQTLGGFHSVG